MSTVIESCDEANSIDEAEHLQMMQAYVQRLSVSESKSNHADEKPRERPPRAVATRSAKVRASSRSASRSDLNHAQFKTLRDLANASYSAAMRDSGRKRIKHRCRRIVHQFFSVIIVIVVACLVVSMLQASVADLGGASRAEDHRLAGAADNYVQVPGNRKLHVAERPSLPTTGHQSHHPLAGNATNAGSGCLSATIAVLNGSCQNPFRLIPQ